VIFQGAKGGISDTLIGERIKKESEREVAELLKLLGSGRKGKGNGTREGKAVRKRWTKIGAKGKMGERQFSRREQLAHQQKRKNGIR